jgi:pilus assembly protein CpaF
MTGLKDFRAKAQERRDDARGREEFSVERYRHRLLEEIDLGELAQLSIADRRARLQKVLTMIVRREGPMLRDEERSALIRRVIDDALGLGVLEPLLADETVTEIMVNGPDQVYVERGGRLERADFGFTSDEQLMQTIDRIVSAVNRRVDESSPMVDARLTTGERVNVVIPPLSLTGPTLTIRRFPRPLPMDELIRRGSLDASTALLLAAMVRARLNVMVSGGTGTGKTTMLNALSSFIPEDQRIITIEDAAELRLDQEHVVGLEARPANVEGRGQVTIRELVRNSLRMRPDRIIVGEVRGGESLDLLQAMNTGHEGSLGTVHANTATDALARLETLASMTELQLPYTVLRDQINSAIECIVQLTRLPDGSRKVAEVAFVASRRHEDYHLIPLMRFAPDPIGVDRRVTGRFLTTPLPVAVCDRLYLAGERVPAAFTPAADGRGAEVSA